MRLGWDEIRRRAKAFSEDWKNAHYEKGETQSFYNDFFEIFGIKRRQVAVYEKMVQGLDANRRGFIDLFWPGTLIVEQKSAGKDLFKAQLQASEYFNWLPERDQPRYILTCDFQRWKLIDLDNNGHEIPFTLPELHKHVTDFDFMLGRRVTFKTQASVTIKAAELMGKLHDALEDSGYGGHDLEQLLVRLLFCLFADDTGIFQPKDIFLQLIDNDTKADGSDVGRVLNELFDVLDTPEDQRQTGLAAELDAFPYVNGALFRGRLRTPVFNARMRDHLLDAARHDWSGVSPAIFGSLFQSVMDAKERRAKGAHYTTETNILKVIGPLFLDDLKADLAAISARKTGREKALQEYLARLTRLTFFDPACGCGNFLVIAYRELRRLELEALKALYGDQASFTVAGMNRVTVNQFYGIEYEEFPARIAEVAMWMMDHIANNEINEAFGLNYANIPLTGSPHILHGDALETDWSSLLPPERCSYIMGNPPFVGAKYQSEFQRAQVRRIAGLGGSGGTLDYVAAWFIKAGQFAKANPRVRIAFVSTNSICQGEQVAQLWPILFDRHGLEIAFAHRTFNWFSEARGKAHVHVVIVGLAHRDHEPAEKRLFSYPDIKGDPVETRHSALTAYLFDARGVANRHLVAKEESRPINGAGKVVIGSKPIDGGHYIFDAKERAEFLAQEPGAARFLRPYIGSQEFINGGDRAILYLGGAGPNEIRQMPRVMERIGKVRQVREASPSKATQALARDPTRFHVTVVPDQPYLVVPKVSSERRDYVPIGWLEPPTIASDLLFVQPSANLFDFAILTSRAHMAWLAHIGGRLESRFRYSIGLVYNTFPWPDATPVQRDKIEALAQAVLNARAEHPTSSLADLYDPDTMPPNLRKAHAALDAAVDRLYRAAPFASDRDRVEHLFGRYEALVNPLERLGAAKNKRVAKKAQYAKERP
jgi:N-6 DNA Methylase